MARVLVDGRWYNGLASNSLLEADYAGMIVGHATDLYPDLHVVPFTKLIPSEGGGGKRPDLAFIDKSYLGWWVVEVELGHHPLNSHVLPQMKVFQHAVYGLEDASYLCSRNPHLDVGQMEDMVRGRQPGVLVVSNKPVPTWVQPLRQEGALLAVVEVFRSPEGRHLVRINGDYPFVEHAEEVLSHCRVDSITGRLLVLQTPAMVPADTVLRVQYEDGMTEWVRTEAADRVFLAPRKRYPLGPNVKEARLLRRPDGTIWLDAGGKGS